MSSFRRRAIWVQRAMSTERSSTGGRASARTTAGASVGSARSRIHASTSRISARRKNAALPTTRCGTARSSSATATAWPSREIDGTSTATCPGGTPSETIRRSMSAAADWACARSFAQRQNCTSPSAEVGSHVTATAAAAARSTRRGSRRLCSSVITWRELLPPRSVAGVRRIGGRGQPRPGHFAAEGRRRQVEVVRIVDQHVLEPLRRRRPLADHPQRVADQVAGVASARLGQHPLVHAVDLGELAPDLGLGLRQPRRPPRVVLGADQVRLQPVDPADEPREQRVRAAAEVVALERQLDRSARAASRTARPGPSTGSSGSTSGPAAFRISAASSTGDITNSSS